MWKQRCKVCRRPDGYDYHVSDSIWAAVIPERLHGSVVCLPCFDRLASSRGVSYVDHIDAEMYFVGEGGAFTLNITKRNEPLFEKCEAPEKTSH